jgi:hypothetical protein
MLRNWWVFKYTTKTSIRTITAICIILCPYVHTSTVFIQLGLVRRLMEEGIERVGGPAIAVEADLCS